MPETQAPETAAPATVAAIPPTRDRAIIVVDCSTAVVSVNLEMDFDAKASGLVNPRAPLVAQCLSNYGSRLVALSPSQLHEESQRLAAALNPPPPEAAPLVQPIPEAAAE